VLRGLSHNNTLINYFLLIKVRIKNHLVFPYIYGFSTISLPLLSFSWVFLILSMLRLQIVNTRNCKNNNVVDNNGENNLNVNPPPPHPPTLEQVLAIQAQMLQTM
jgi:hypothetical protein